MRGREPELELSTVRVKGEGGEKSESDLNVVGPKPPAQVRPVRPVAHTGQTGPG